MRMQISAHGFELTDELRHEVMGEIERLVQSVDRPVNVISVQLYDERGVAARGLDRRCRISVEFEDQVRVEDSDSEASFHDCICEAFTKLMQDEQHAH
ncbi:MAG TPA: HPF/RaiA family ribosome-associated protein [Steroidobacteraceae bacterium]|nr:HPF/RaiA family ribosome-associated protein [Steroidobacteraceae bacterium]